MREFMKRLGGGMGHLLLLVGFAAYALWYSYDAWNAQPRVENMLLIGPAAALAFAVIVILFLREARQMVQGEQHDPLAPPNTTDQDAEGSFRQTWGTPLSAILLAAYVLSVPFVGFDVATVVYVASCMILQGARGWRIILPFSLVSGLLPVWAIEKVLSIPIPATFL